MNYSVDFSNENLLTRAYCYPNPIKNITGKIRVETNNARFLDLKLYDASGFFIQKFTKDVSSSGYYITEWELDTSNLEAGIYFARLEVKANSSNSQSDQSKIIKIAVIK